VAGNARPRQDAFVCGWIENTSDTQTAENMVLTATTLGSDGEVVGVGAFSPGSKRLAPHEKVPFVAYVAAQSNTSPYFAKARVEVGSATGVAETQPYLWSEKYALTYKVANGNLTASVKPKSGGQDNLAVVPMVVVVNSKGETAGMYAPVRTSDGEVEQLPTSDDGKSLDFQTGLFPGVEITKKYTSQFFVAPQ